MNLLILTEENILNLNNPYDIGILIVGVLIAIVAVIAGIMSLILMIKYLKYNHKKNSAGLKGKEIARKILDHYGLQKIKVKYSGSLIFGNSYSHYFKKVRLRRISFNKKSVSALAMASQKASLALLDKENDPDMKKRIKLVPLITFGPFLFVPIVLVGIIIDLFLFQQESVGVATLISLGLGLLFYIYSFILSIKVLKTEKKAQAKALKVVKDLNLATSEEVSDMKELFELYNKEYVLNIILSFLEIISYVLRILSALQSGSSNISSNNNKGN